MRVYVCAWMREYVITVGVGGPWRLCVCVRVVGWEKKKKKKRGAVPLSSGEASVRLSTA